MSESKLDPALLETLPEPRLQVRRRFSIVWVIPLVAALIGLGLIYKTLSERGPTITIVFKTAEGLVAGKTKIKYKDVEVGRVESIVLSSDLSRVVVTAAMTREAEPYLTEETRFWVVRARIAAGEVSGLSTLFSGAVIALEPGTKGKSQRSFFGLDRPPVVTGDFPGRHFKLKADRLGSLDVGAPVYYRQIRVGQVDSYDIQPDGQAVIVGIFIDAPYHRYVSNKTRFWNASGLDVRLDTEGIRIDTPSMVSLLIGGIAFDNPVGIEPGEPAQEGHVFELYDGFESSRQQTFSIKDRYLLYFEDSVRGLAAGAPVEFKGIRIGQVLDLSLEFDPEAVSFRIPVLIEIEPERFVTEQTAWTQDYRRAIMNRLVAKGLRARLKTSSFLTGRMMVDLSVDPKAPAARIVWGDPYPQLPTTGGSLQELTATVIDVVERLDRFPLEEIGVQVRTVLGGLNATLDSTRQKIEGLPAQEIGGELKAAVKDLSATLASTRGVMEKLQGQVTDEALHTLGQVRQSLASMENAMGQESTLNHEAHRAARELADAARAIRILADYLARHPEALLYGKDPGK
jgi:paraquat-inducible protein B